MTRAAITILSWLVLVSIATAQPVDEVFVHHSLAQGAVQALPDARSPRDVTRAAIMTRVTVGIRVDVLFDRPEGPARRIVLNVGDQSWTARFERLDADVSGFRSWVGRIEGGGESHVVLTERNGVLSGLITSPDATYQVRTVTEGVAHSLERVDVARLPGEAEPLLLDAPSTPARPATAATASDRNTVDVLILYTSAARAVWGGTPQLQALASQVISDTNSAFVRSGVAARVRLVAAHEIGLAEAPSMQTDLSAVRWDADARFLREAYQADLVHLLVSSPDLSTCGVAYLLATDAMDFDAYSVADVTCAAGYTPTHEMAHNFGSHHAPEDGAAGALFPYSYGLKDSNRGFRTIMAYGCVGAPCPRVPIFSNPAITQNDGPAGTSFQNNARSLNEATPYVARFRGAPGSTEQAPPGAPQGLESSINGTHVTVTWTPSAGAAAYILQVGSSPGTSNVFSASVGGATSASGSVPPGMYFWRVFAVNNLGQSGPSPESQFVVGCTPPAAPTGFLVSVSGQSVTLTWTPSAGAPPDAYVVEAGSAPSLANLLAAPVGLQTIVATAAPPGTYYVRIRAHNACGASAPSNEQIIVVP